MVVSTEISAITRNRTPILPLLTGIDCLLILPMKGLLTASATCPFLHWLPSTHQETNPQQIPHLNGQADPLPTCMSSCSTLQCKQTECVSWHLLALCLRQPTYRTWWVISKVNSLPVITDWLTDQPTNSKEQTTSSESNSASANQEIPHILWNQMVHYHFYFLFNFLTVLFFIHYHVHNSPWLLHILRLVIQQQYQHTYPVNIEISMVYLSE